VIPAIVKERKRANEIASAPNEKRESEQSVNVEKQEDIPVPQGSKVSGAAKRSDTSRRNVKSASTTVQKSDASSKPKTASLASNSGETKVTRRAPKKINTKLNEENEFIADEPVQASQYAGIKYWVDMESDKGLDRVATNHVFRAGDRIKIRIVPNINGYLYVYNKGTTGRQTRLFPAGDSSSARVATGVTYTVPAAGLMRFDENPGREEIGVFLTDRPISMDGTDDKIAQSGQRATYASATPVSCKGSKDLILNMDCVRKSTGSKDLLLEKSTDNHGVAEYAVAPMSDVSAGQSVSINFFLNHK
jgi:Domain of unknown function (DUF4384)